MFLHHLLENVLLPFAVLLVAAGFYLGWRLAFRYLRHYFLSLKLLSGALDWKSSPDKLTPFSATSLGRIFENFPVAVAATYLAYNFYGPGVWFWLFLSVPLVMGLDFALGTLSHAYRRKLSFSDEGVYRMTSPLNLVDAAFSLPLMRGFFGAGAFLASVVQAAGLPLLVLWYVATELAFPYPLSLALLLVLVVFIFATGRLGRLGRFGRIAAASGLSFSLLFAFSYGIEPRAALRSDVSLHSIFTLAQNTFWPESFLDWLRMLTALGAYWGLIGIGGLKTATLAGSIRSDYPAKAGFSLMATTPFSVFVISPVTIYFIINRFSLLHLGKSDPFQLALLLVAVLSFLFVGIVGWVAAGRQISGSVFSFLFTKNPDESVRKGENAYYTLLVLVIFGFLFFLVAKPYDAPYAILLIVLLAGLLPAFVILSAVLLLGRKSEHELNRYRSSLEARYEILKDFALLLFHVLPKNLLSRLFGYLSYVRLPRFLRTPIITAFARAYQIDVEEAEGSIADYPSLNKFFTRALREGVRVIAHEPNVLVSPVDGRLSQFGPIQDGLLIQAKGLYYRASDLVQDSGFEDRLSKGSFGVLYLSPQDYHRIHSPESGRILGYSYHPGQLFPVNRLMVEGLAGLFPKNERLTTFLETAHGLIAVVKVGATNVGRIALAYDTIRSNTWLRKERHLRYDSPLSIERGAELGRFEMGSTVILLVEDPAFAWLPDFHEGSRVRFGQILGRFT